MGHVARGLSDKHDRVFSLGNRNSGLRLGSLTPEHNFSDDTTSLLHPNINFGSCCESLTPMFQSFHLRGLKAPFLLRPTHINYFHFMI